MYLENINIIPQGMSSILSNHLSDSALCINRDSVLSVENSSGKFVDTKDLNSKLIDVKEEPIYMAMSRTMGSISNSHEIYYDELSHGYFFNKSLFIENRKINFFVDLDEKEIEKIFSDLKNKGYDVNQLLTKKSLESTIDKSIEENIYETIDNNCLLKEKLELIDELSNVISTNNQLKGNFKDNLIKVINDIPLSELFSSCEKYEEQYEIQDSFLISRFIYRFIDDFNKSNNNKIKVNEDLKRRLNSIVLLKSLILKDNNII
ncbi:hypothetical protein I5E97_09835 [Proteus hauseri]|uniref:hypothetical protein n=1 Tax=Proteus cibi TaxID=2050966 RepID=UPI000D693B01|nr:MULTISPECIES: hypothetical protein [Proteus]MBG6031350.1 hypothetical protein [Proteus hauseri]MBS6210155.1 hypothetical protein [Proteus hauseri]